MLLSRTLRYLPAQLIGPLSQFVAVVVWTHFLPPAAYGTVALIMALQELISRLCLGWWSSYILRYAATFTPDMQERQGAHENAVLLASSILQVVVTWIVLAASSLPLTPDLVAAAVAFTISRSLTTHMVERARSIQAIAIYTVAQTVGPVIGLGLGTAVVWTYPSAAAALAGLALAQIVVLPFLWRALIPSHRLLLDRSNLKQALIFSLPLIASSAVGWAVVNGIRLIVEEVEGAEAVGLISVGWSLGHRLMSVVAMLVTAAAFPIAVDQMVRSGKEAAYAQVARNSVLLLAIVVPGAAGILCLTPAIVEMLIGAQFHTATLIVLPVATLAAAIHNVRLHTIDQVFLLCERPRVILYVDLVELTLTVAGCWFGLVHGGFLGACLGCLAANVVALALCGWCAYREGLRLPLLPIGKIMLATCLMAAVVTLAPSFPGRLGLAVDVAAGGGLYILAMALLFRQHWPQIRQAA